MAEAPEDLRGQFRRWLEELVARATKLDYRGCGNTNAAVEYPDRSTRRANRAAANKRSSANVCVFSRTISVRRILRSSVMRFLLVIEGAHVSGLMFGPGAPARVAVEAADALIDAHTVRRRKRSR